MGHNFETKTKIPDKYKGGGGEGRGMRGLGIDQAITIRSYEPDVSVLKWKHHLLVETVTPVWQN